MIEFLATNYGFKTTFSGDITEDQLNKWIEDSNSKLENPIIDFGCLIDMRDINQISSNSHKLMMEGLTLFKNKGMLRSAVVLSNSEIAKQYRIIGKQTGEAKYEKYIDGSTKQNWEIIAVEWITSGIDL